jgi:beta-glucanase (GH16 family)
MSSRSRMMGAGNASSTSYDTNVNLNTFGGNKKQGITSRVGLDNWANQAVQTYSNGYGRHKLFCMNQLGGVGAGKSMFNGRFTQTDGTHCTNGPTIPAGPTIPSPFKLLWEQTFDQPNGTPPNATFWNYDLGDGTSAGNPGWGNNELEWYTEEAVKTRDGKLVFTATKLQQPSGLNAYYGSAEWSSGRINTKNKVEVKYGRIEATIKAPTGSGTWPAFWMLGTNIDDVPWPGCGEIDILEMRGSNPNNLVSTLHGPGYSGGDGITTELLVPPLNQGFHTFGIDWRENEIIWHFDGNPFFKLTPASVAPNTWVFNNPQYLLLNLAMGGNFTGAISPSLTQAEMQVESVRVYSLNGIGEVNLL